MYLFNWLMMFLPGRHGLCTQEGHIMDQGAHSGKKTTEELTCM